VDKVALGQIFFYSSMLVLPYLYHSAGAAYSLANLSPKLYIYILSFNVFRKTHLKIHMFHGCMEEGRVINIIVEL
jgi:uncharacterized membrane protein